MIINNIKLLGSRIIPNPIEVDYWVDTKSDPYGSVIKYHNGSEWVPLFTNNDVEHNIDLSNYYTKQQVDSIVETKVDESYVLTQVNQLGSIKADKSSVYTKTEIDDKGYLTSIPSIYITEEKLYNNVYTKAEVNQKIADAALNGTVDLSNYYTKEEVNNIIPTDTVSTLELSNALQTKQDVITAGNNVSIDNNTINVNIDLSDYALKQDIPSLDEYALKDEIPSLEGYAKTEDVPSLDGYATEQWVNDKGYLTTHQDISHLANKSDVYTKDEVDSLVDNVTVDLSDYYSKTETNTLLSSYAKTNNVYDKATVDQKIADVTTSGQVDLSNYYNKQEVDSLIEGIDIPEIPEIPTKTSLLENDVPFATAIALSEGLSLKLNNISDLETIRQGALLGATAILEHQDISGKANVSDIPTKISQLENDANYLTSVQIDEATIEQSGLMSAEDKLKLDSLSTDAGKNVQSDWNEEDTSSDAYILNKPNIISQVSVTSHISTSDYATKAATITIDGVDTDIYCRNHGNPIYIESITASTEKSSDGSTITINLSKSFEDRGLYLFSFKNNYTSDGLGGTTYNGMFSYAAGSTLVCMQAYLYDDSYSYWVRLSTSGHSAMTVTWKGSEPFEPKIYKVIQF